jgi:hypothetical protein
MKAFQRLAGALTVTSGPLALVWAPVRSNGPGWNSIDVIGGLAWFFLMPYFQRVRGDTPIEAGLMVIVPGCITMLGGGLMFAPITVAATAGVGPGQSGLASGLLNTTAVLSAWRLSA